MYLDKLRQLKFVSREKVTTGAKRFVHSACSHKKCKNDTYTKLSKFKSGSRSFLIRDHFQPNKFYPNHF